VKHAKKKIYKGSLSQTEKKYNQRVLERIHLDLVGPMQTESYNKTRYILNLTDDYSRVVMTRAIATKDKAGYVMMEMIKAAEVMTNQKVAYL
jgi:ribulose 1,5-bisphosphate carboxylase large subunit-like protein